MASSRPAKVQPGSSSSVPACGPCRAGADYGLAMNDGAVAADTARMLVLDGGAADRDRPLRLLTGPGAALLHLATPFSLYAGDREALCAAHLQDRLSRLHRLEAVIAIGSAAHLAILSACGIPMARAPYRPGHITRLPDGLLLAAADTCESSPEADARLLRMLVDAMTGQAPETPRSKTPGAMIGTPMSGKDPSAIIAASALLPA